MGSLLCGTYMLSGPLVGGLVNRFGCRTVCMLGAVVAWAAISLSTLSPSPAVLMLTYGLLGGFGLGLIYLPAIVSVGFYFESRRALATGKGGRGRRGPPENTRASYRYVDYSGNILRLHTPIRLRVLAMYSYNILLLCWLI